MSLNFDEFFSQLDKQPRASRCRYPAALLNGAAERINSGEKTAKQIAQALLKTPQYRDHTEVALIAAITRAARSKRRKLHGN